MNNPKKKIVLCKCSTKEVLFQWYHCMIASTDSEFLYWICHGESTQRQGWNRTYIPILKSTPSIPTQPMKGCTTPSGPMPPTLYQHQCGFFMSHRNQNSERAMRQHLRFFCPYLRRLECIILCRCHNKGSTFSSFILRPWVLVWPRFEPVTSSSADRHLSNWADRVAEVRAMTHLTITWSLSSYLKLHLVKWIKKIFSWKKHF